MSLFNKPKKVVEHKTESNKQSPHDKYSWVLDGMDKIWHSELDKLNPRDPDYRVKITQLQRKLNASRKTLIKVVQDTFGDPSDALLFDENGKFKGRNS